MSLQVATLSPLPFSLWNNVSRFFVRGLVDGKSMHTISLCALLFSACPPFSIYALMLVHFFHARGHDWVNALSTCDPSLIRAPELSAPQACNVEGLCRLFSRTQCARTSPPLTIGSAPFGIVHIFMRCTNLVDVGTRPFKKQTFMTIDWT